MNHIWSFDDSGGNFKNKLKSWLLRGTGPPTNQEMYGSCYHDGPIALNTVFAEICPNAQNDQVDPIVTGDLRIKKN